MTTMATASARWRGVDVLLVEDEPIVAMMIEDVFTEIGCKVLIASNVLEALAFLQRKRPVAAILDVNLGEEYAFPIAERLRAERIPFLFTTGYGRSRLLADWRDCVVVQKPFEPSALVKALATILDR